MTKVDRLDQKRPPLHFETFPRPLRNDSPGLEPVLKGIPTAVGQDIVQPNTVIVTVPVQVIDAQIRAIEESIQGDKRATRTILEDVSRDVEQKFSQKQSEKPPKIVD